MTKEDRLKADEALNAKGAPVRLKVPAKGGLLHETILDVFRVFQPGEVFEHPQPKRAQRLIELGLAVKTDDPTAAEVANFKEEERLAIDEIMEQQREKAKKLLQSRKDKLGAFEAKLVKMNDETLAAELKARKLDADENRPAKTKAILDDELAKIKAAE